MPIEKYRLLAELMLGLHLLGVAFVAVTCAAVMIEPLLRWGWIRNFWLRSFHLGSLIATWGLYMGDRPCPLSVWEERFRLLAGQEPRSFASYWINGLLHLPHPELVARVALHASTAAALGLFFLVPPRAPRKT